MEASVEKRTICLPFVLNSVYFNLNLYYNEYAIINKGGYSNGFVDNPATSLIKSYSCGGGLG